jgi:hypothetical protein
VVFHGGQAAQHIGQIFLRVDAATAATLNDGVDDRTAPAGVGMADEAPALATHHRGPHVIFYAEEPIMPSIRRMITTERMQINRSSA